MSTQFIPGFIVFHFEGIVALCVKEGRDRFDAAIVRDTESDDGEIDDHDHSIEIVKWREGEKEDTDIPTFNRGRQAHLLHLELNRESGSSRQGIQLVKEDTGRAVAFNFSWVADCNELKQGEPAHPCGAALRTVLRVTGIELGWFLTGSIGSTPLSMFEPNGNSLPLYGVAASVKAFMELPCNGAWLKKFNAQGKLEDSWSLLCEEGVSYEIFVRNVCEDDSCSVDTTSIYNNLIKCNHNGDPPIQFSMEPRPGSNSASQLMNLTNSALLDLTMTWEMMSGGPIICPSMNFSESDELPLPGSS